MIFKFFIITCIGLPGCQYLEVILIKVIFSKVAIFWLTLQYFKCFCYRSSIFHNTSAIHGAWHEWDTNNTGARRTTQLSHEWKILILITTRVKTYFHTPILAIWQMKDYKERNNFILRSVKDYLLEMPPSHAKMRLESAPQKLNFVMIKVGKKSLSSLNYYKRMS